jgi:eukaryotic-like serine/threonine-protein kinase
MAATGTVPILVDHFQLLEEIGSGCYSRVFRAKDLSSGADVAVKVLRRRLLGSADAIERFRREVFAVASISSPHVVAMYDFAVSGEEIFIAMERAEGPTLRERFNRGAPPDADEILRVASQIADALTAAHAQRIVHRDLKPENIKLVTTPGGPPLVKVLDFGFAKLLDLERKLELKPLTRMGMTFGTPQYMAPEMVRGRKFDHTADLWALGVIVFEMLTATRPWDGPDPYEVMRSILNYPAPPLSRLAPALPRLAELDRFLQRAFAKRPDDRFPTAADFKRELAAALFDRPPLAPLPVDAFRSVEIDLGDL